MDRDKWPYVLTGEEVLAMLRIEVAKPTQKLQELRSRGMPGARLGKEFTYPRDKVLRWYETVCG